MDKMFQRSNQSWKKLRTSDGNSHEIGYINCTGCENGNWSLIMIWKIEIYHHQYLSKNYIFVHMWMIVMMSCGEDSYGFLNLWVVGVAWVRLWGIRMRIDKNECIW